MRLTRWLCGVGVFSAIGAGMLVEQACSSSDFVVDGGITYVDAAPIVTTSSSSSAMKSDAGDSGAVATFGPGDGGPCSGPVGGFPSPYCDPSDEVACAPNSCAISPQCGASTSACEAFVTNPPLGKGIQNFRMRLINLTAPTALANAVVQGSVVTAAVDLPSNDAGACGENGTGLFNWLIQVDQANNKVTTGGAPPSADPVTTGYCFVNSVVGGTMISPSVLTPHFTGNTFTTTPIPGTLNIPIFVAGGGEVLLPLNGATFSDVAITDDGNCIGQVNNNSIMPTSAGPCTDSNATGQGSCSRWHTAATLGAYITLAQADMVPVVTLGNESLCVLLTGQNNGMNKCPTAALTMGNYCSKTLQAGGCNDSVWLSAQFAASAVNIVPGATSGVKLCGG